MKLLLAIILSVNLFMGVFLVGYGLTSSTAPIAVWSDFEAFSAKIAADETVAHVLNYGGENEETDFEYLLGRVWDLGDAWDRVSIAGFALIVSSMVGLVVVGRWRGEAKSVQESTEYDAGASSR